MKFNEFCSILYPIFKCICHNQCDLFDFLVLNCIDENQEKLKDELSRLSSKSKKSLVTGKTSFGRVASKIYGYFDNAEFQERVDNEISVSSMVSFLPVLQQEIPDITENNFSEKLGEKFCDIVRSEASSYRNKKCLEKIEFKVDESKSNLGAIAISIDIELINALEKLLESPNENKIKLNLTALRIDEKIDLASNLLLSKKVKSYVSEYFPIMNEFLHNRDGKGDKSFEKLAVTMRALYLEVSEKVSTKDKVFDCIVDEIQKGTGSCRTVAEIIVSYFIQDCEVFDEISK